jgi:hypothetical protein
MLGFIGLAGGLGFLASFALLHAGLQTLAVRYGLAALAGYGGFFLGIRVWLWLRKRPAREDESGAADTGADPLDIISFGSGGGGRSTRPFRFGGGGGFSGGGAGGRFDWATESPQPSKVKRFLTQLAKDDDDDGGGGGGGGGAVLLVVAVVVLLVIVVASVVSVVAQAPDLLAEVLVDGAIAGAAFRGLRDVPRRSWAEGVLRRTWKPMLALTTAVVGFGALVQVLRPGADSIGDLLP